MLTLEERERIAYITNSPDHPLIVEAIEGDEDKDELEKELEEAEERVTRQSGEIEDLEIKLADAADTILALNKRIHEAGVDLV